MRRCGVIFGGLCVFCYLRVEEIDCMVTPPDDLPPAAGSVRYTDIGKAYLKYCYISLFHHPYFSPVLPTHFMATAAKSISMQMRKFWYPADIVPGEVVYDPSSL